jgi:peptide/nickel transport system substrate-binding protein
MYGGVMMTYRWLLNPKWLLFIPLLVVLVIGVACGGDDPTSTPQPTATPVPQPTATPVPVAQPTPTAPPVMAKLEPKYGGVVPMQTGSGPPTTWDPHQANFVESIQLTGQFYNSLLQDVPTNPTEIEGDLVKTWEVSDDGLAYTFHLRDDVKWSDGQDLDADDVVFSLNRMIEEGQPRPNTSKIKPYTDRIEKIDKYTVRVHLVYPSTAFLQFLSVDYYKILPKHVLEAGVDLALYENNTVTTGPFKGVSFTHGDSYEFEKNPDYFKEGLPYFDGINGFFIGDKGTEIAAYRTERILMSISIVNKLDIEDILRLEADEEFSSRFGFWTNAGLAGQDLAMNTRKPPFDDDRVRMAMILALDRQPLVDGFGLGKYDPGVIMAPNNPYALPVEEVLEFPGYRTLNGKKHPDDIAEAIRLLKEAGYGPDNPLKFELLVNNILFFSDASQVIKEQLKRDLGFVEVTLAVTEFTAAINRAVARDFEMFTIGVANTIPDPDDSFPSVYLPGDRNWGGWSDPEVTELWNKQSRETDFEKRKAINWEMQRIVLSKPTGRVVYLWISFTQVVSKRIMTTAGEWVPHNAPYSRLKHEFDWLEPK